MGDHQRSPTAESFSIFGIPKNASLKDMCKSYKSLFYMKWHSDKSPKSDKEDEAEAKYEAKFQAYKARNGKKQDDKQNKCDGSSTPLKNQRSVDDGFVVRQSFFAKCASRRSHTPSPRPTYLSKSASKRSNTPPKSPLSFLSRSRSKKPTSEFESPSTSGKGSPNLSRRGSPNSSRKGSPNSSRKGSRGSPNSSRRGSQGSPNSSRRGSRGSPNSNRRSAAETDSPSAASDVTESPKIARTMSRRNTIIYSQTSARRKPPPVEKKLECTLEELFRGGVKKIMMKRETISDEGLFVQEEEMLKINLKPGWKKGTKITFEGKGDERPGYLPADIIFSIDEKRHHLFRREGDDLQLGVEIPLVQALTGCLISVPLLGGEKMSLSLDEIIFPGFQKVIKGQGMPNPKHQGQRGDLKIDFLVNFPLELDDEQRSEAVDILKDCSYE